MLKDTYGLIHLDMHFLLILVNFYMIIILFRYDNPGKRLVLPTEFHCVVFLAKESWIFPNLALICREEEQNNESRDNEDSVG